MNENDLIMMSSMMAAGTNALLQAGQKTATTQEIINAAKLCDTHRARMVETMSGCLEQVHDLVAIDEASRPERGMFSIGGEVIGHVVKSPEEMLANMERVFPVGRDP